jgi:LPXTG-motif cell wall-anchored protein
LAPGAYYFTEKKAPTGYALSKEKRRFTIASSEKNKPATIDLGKFVNTESPKAPDVPKSSNKPTTSETASGSYPKTNDTRNPWLLVAGVGIVLIAGILYYRKRKH